MSTSQKVLQAKRKQKARQLREASVNVKESITNINETKDDSKEDTRDHTEKSIDKSIKLWNNIKQRIKDEPSFIDLSDADKLKVYQDSEYKEFYTEFPIVCRYMICMGQFSNKAFKRFLLKCKSIKPDPIKAREKGYNDDQWISRQADYVRYLWEAYQKQHYSASESRNIWQHAYKTLKQEFADFHEMHKEVEEKLKKERKENKTELTKELLKRLADKDQSLNENSTTDLVKKLQTRVYEQRKKKLLDSIENEVEIVPPTREARGCRKELKSAK